MPEQVSMEDIARRRRVEAVREAASRLAPIQAEVQHALARLPSIARELEGIRNTIERALRGEDIEEEDEGGTDEEPT
jgi:hypothetical protein